MSPDARDPVSTREAKSIPDSAADEIQRRLLELEGVQKVDFQRNRRGAISSIFIEITARQYRGRIRRDVRGVLADFDVRQILLQFHSPEDFPHGFVVRKNSAVFSEAYAEGDEDDLSDEVMSIAEAINTLSSGLMEGIIPSQEEVEELAVLSNRLSKLEQTSIEKLRKFTVDVQRIEGDMILERVASGIEAKAEA